MIPISICYITKNESDLLEKNLTSLNSLLQGITPKPEILVVDTGSTDGTLSMLETMPCRVAHFTWCNDFSAARNYAIQVATHDYILFLDTDEIPISLDWAQLQHLLQMHPLAVGCFLRQNLTVGPNGTLCSNDRVERLFHRGYYHYECRIHEQLTANSGELLTVYDIPFTVLHEGYLGDLETRKNKAKRNNDLLFLELEEHPGDAYLYYQIGKSYGLMEDIPSQYEYLAEAYTRRPDPSCSYYQDLIITLGHAMLTMNKPEEAVQLLAEEYDRFQNSADFLCFGGSTYLRLGMLLEAIDFFQNALLATEYSLEGTNSHLPHHNLGCIYEALENEEEALMHYAMAGNYAPSQAAWRSLSEHCPEEKIYQKKISVIAPANASTQEVHHLLEQLKKQTVGLCHIELLLPCTEEAALAALSPIEELYPQSILLLALYDTPPAEITSTCISYTSGDAVYFDDSSRRKQRGAATETLTELPSEKPANLHKELPSETPAGLHEELPSKTPAGLHEELPSETPAGLHADAFRQLRLALIQEDGDFACSHIQLPGTEELEYFVIDSSPQATKEELLRTNLLGPVYQHKLYARTFLMSHPFAYPLTIGEALDYSERIICTSQELL